MIEDLSYSGIVKELQGDSKKAASLIVELAQNIEENNALITNLTVQLNKAKNDKRRAGQAIKYVQTHQEANKSFDFPIRILNNGKILQITQEPIEGSFKPEDTYLKIERLDFITPH